MTIVDIDTLFTPLDADDVLADLLGYGVTLGLDTTAWQVGQPERTILAIAAQVIADQGQIISLLTKAGFLDEAAKITPEGGPGWLDLLAARRYQVTREPATYANTPVTITAAGASGGTFAAGTLHFIQANGSTYTNTDPVTIPSTGTTSVHAQADAAGSSSSAGAGVINALLTPLIGVTVTNPAAAIGADAETNASLVSRCRARLAALSVDGPGGAYDYAARTINGENEVPVSSGPLTQPLRPVTRTAVVTDPANGDVTIYVANDAGGYPAPPNYVEQTSKPIVSSTNATPIVVEVTGHGYVTGDQVFVDGHLVNTPANGGWPITVIDAGHFSLNGSIGSGVGGATGTAYRYSDLDLIDQSIEKNAVPQSVTHHTVTADELAWTVNGAITVTGPAASLTDAQIASKASTALAELAKTVPIGGQGSSGLLYLETVRAAIVEAVGAINVVLTSPAADLAIGPHQVLVAPSSSLTVTRV